ncbi:unnamed protein product [Protopolystoma xenopodis]|uniref:Uncharacterized protein n=1 Tax=Protopolystoma xenopodis TaxID=117903 RepID=A0A3S5CFY8_9PLAT|nr:unnamed protein product [Protopolystoma xenopodis]
MCAKQLWYLSSCPGLFPHPISSSRPFKITISYLFIRAYFKPIHTPCWSPLPSHTAGNPLSAVPSTVPSYAVGSFPCLSPSAANFKALLYPPPQAFASTYAPASLTEQASKVWILNCHGNQT